MLDALSRETLALFEKAMSDRLPRIKDFYSGRRAFLVWTQAPSAVWADCRTPQRSFEENMKAVRRSLEVEMDSLPYLEPWHGVGVYACSFGCAYEWWEGEAPYTRPAFSHVREALEQEPLRPRDNEVMRLIMDTIAYFKKKTGSAIPIVLTDTQSANDTATLIVDSSNFMVECITEEENAHRLLGAVNAAIIEFSWMQADLIGDALATPGHIMLSAPGIGGISVSDDNQSFCSAEFNRRFTNPYNDALGAQFGGVAVHSCGNWAHAMPALLEMDYFPMLDCACDASGDPCPNAPSVVAETLAGTGKIAQMRCGGSVEAIDRIVEEAARPGLRLILQFNWPGDPQTAAMLYEHALARLEARYARGEP